MHGKQKASTSPRTLRTLKICLPISDVGVGLFGQPFYISPLVKLLQNDNCGCVYYQGLNITQALVIVCLVLICKTK